MQRCESNECHPGASGSHGGGSGAERGQLARRQGLLSGIF